MFLVALIESYTCSKCGSYDLAVKIPSNFLCQCLTSLKVSCFKSRASDSVA